MGRDRDERGQTTVMIVGFVAVLALAIAVVTDASAAYLQRSGLDTVADGAALAGAQALDERAAYQRGLGDEPRVGAALARERVTTYLRDTGAHDRFPGLRVTTRVDGNRVVVQVSAPLDLPLDVPGVQGDPTIAATGAAELTPMGSGST